MCGVKDVSAMPVHSGTVGKAILGDGDIENMLGPALSIDFGKAFHHFPGILGQGR